MKIKHKILNGRIHQLIFNTQRDLTSTFLRFQEYYESPEFKEKIFSLYEFKKWYIKNSPRGRETGKFTYFTDWNGFNIPSYVLKPFYVGDFSPLSRQEMEFLELFKGKKEPFYIIGIHKEMKKLNSFLKHEIAHGFFYTNENYRREVLEILSRFDIEPIKKELRLKAGYHEQVLEDEVHAYSIVSGRKLKTPIPRDLFKELRKIYRKYMHKYT